MKLYSLYSLFDSAPSSGVPIDPLILAEREKAFAIAFGQLPDFAQQVLRLRYALEGGEPLDLRSTGRKLGVRFQKVHYAERKALASLRVALEGFPPDRYQPCPAQEPPKSGKRIIRKSGPLAG